MPGHIYDVMDAYRKALHSHDATVMADLAKAHQLALKRIETQIANHRRKAALGGGEWRTYAVLRLEQMREDVTRIIQQLTHQDRQTIASEIQTAEKASIDAADAVFSEVKNSFGRYDNRAVTSMAAMLSDESPLSELLAARSGGFEQEVKAALLRGVSTGAHPFEVARMIRKASKGNLSNVQTIARTEIMRARREAMRQQLLSMRNVCVGWTWRCTLTRSTCMACIALDGEEFSLDTPMGTHPNCRCYMEPISKDIGIESPTPKRFATDWFERQSEDVQKKMMGNAKYDAWKAGDLQLKDLIGYRDDPKWGPTRGVRSLADALTGEAKGALGNLEPGGAQKPIDMILERESQIRNQKFETAYMVDSDGNVVIDKNGGEQEVRFTQDETDAIKAADGVIFTHNHPAGWRYPADHPLHQGYSFSPMDIYFAISMMLDEIRTVTPTSTYSLKPGDTHWNSAYWSTVVNPLFDKIELSVIDSLKERVKRNEITFDEADQLFLHEMWKLIAKRLGMVYTRKDHE